jgi:(2Fe-2S) ferredoxin
MFTYDNNTITSKVMFTVDRSIQSHLEQNRLAEERVFEKAFHVMLLKPKEQLQPRPLSIG